MKPCRSIAVSVNLALNCSDEQLRRHFEEFSQRLFLSFADRALAIDHFRNLPSRHEDRPEATNRNSQRPFLPADSSRKWEMRSRPHWHLNDLPTLRSSELAAAP